ncbi:MAG: stage V sporulation protein AA [Lachnospiraceae bacterium]|nr:stage V sporulation protein AA [Lachnospiraceae bacterium]
MTEQVYIKFNLSSKVHKTSVTVGDVAKVYCADTKIQQHIRALKIYTFRNPKSNRIIFSALKVIEIICHNIKNVDINHIGEPDFVLEYEPLGKKANIPPVLGAIVCSIIIFFGSAFAIMTFNNETNMTNLFAHIYEDLTGDTHPGFGLLEIAYSVGIGLGIIIFYNHFGPKKLSNDPTPLEMEMRQYETSLETALIDGARAKEDHIDVD